MLRCCVSPVDLRENYGIWQSSFFYRFPSAAICWSRGNWTFVPLSSFTCSMNSRHKPTKTLLSCLFAVCEWSFGEHEDSLVSGRYCVQQNFALRSELSIQPPRPCALCPCTVQKSFWLDRKCSPHMVSMLNVSSQKFVFFLVFFYCKQTIKVNLARFAHLPIGHN